MSKLIDVVNFNADASCLSSKWWLKVLQGGNTSYLCKWLKIYVSSGKKVSIGFTGAAIADISSFNPEAIEYINKHRDIFEIILRPFAHDIGLLRSTKGFQINLEAGISTIKAAFKTYTNFYLPPEFMLTNEQIQTLNEFKIDGTFINAARFKEEITDRLPNTPYKIKGLFDSELSCIPFNSSFTQAFLNSIHLFKNDNWNSIINENKQPYLFSWRDGESSFFLPDGNYREEKWITNETKKAERVFLSEALNNIKFRSIDGKENQYPYYPVHSFTAWMKEFRMIGFISKIQEIEKNLKSFTNPEISLWLQLINSDILSSIEKDSPIIKIKLKEADIKVSDYTIWRSDRGMEGEEMLALISRGLDNKKVTDYIQNSPNPHIRKLKVRSNYLLNILNNIL